MIQDLLTRLRSHYTGIISISTEFNMNSDDSIEIEWNLYVDGKFHNFPDYKSLHAYVHGLTDQNRNNIASSEITLLGSMNPEEIHGNQ